MNPPISQIRLRLGAQNRHLLGRPAQPPGGDGHQKPLDPRRHVGAVPHADLLELLVFGPGVARPIRLLFLHRGKAGTLEHALNRGDVDELVAGLGEAVVEQLAGLRKGRVLRVGAVVGDGHPRLLHLDPAAGREVVVALLEQCGPVGDGAGHGTDVDVVELVGKGPLVFYVVDLEVDVGRGAGRGCQFWQKTGGRGKKNREDKGQEKRTSRVEWARGRYR